MFNQIWHCPYLRLFYYPILWYAKWYETWTTPFESPKPVSHTNLMPGSTFFRGNIHVVFIAANSAPYDHHHTFYGFIFFFDFVNCLSICSMSFKAPHPEASPSPCQGSPSLSASASALSDKWLDANWGAVPRNLKLWSGIASSSQIIMIIMIIIFVITIISSDSPSPVLACFLRLDGFVWSFWKHGKLCLTISSCA